MAILTPRRPGALAWMALAALLATTTVSAQPGEVDEDDIKAAFLYNFAKFVEWPGTDASADDFRICVIADADFVQHVDNIVAGETIAGRSVTRQIPTSPEGARACQILFVSRAAADRSSALLTAVHSAHVLTVGDASNFLARGGIVSFVREGDRVRFDINVDTAQRAGLTISSRLLRLARRVLPAAPGL